MAKHAGLRLVVFNMGLSLRTQMYGFVKLSDSKVINELKKVLTNHVKKQGGFAWMNQLSSRGDQNTLIDLKDAFNRYPSSKWAHPTFASQGSRWFVSFCVDAERKEVQQTQGSVGIDLEIKAFATMSKNQVFDALKPLKQAKNKLAIQGQASKQVKGSNNQRQTYNKMMRIHSRISGSRKELLHKLKTPTVKSLKLIKIGELNVKGMMANPKLGLAISNVGFD